MRLAVIDTNDQVLIAWPSVLDAHADIADQLAATLHPSRLASRKRAKTAIAIRTHLLDLQRQTVRL